MQKKSKAIITVIGQDHVGIVARVTTLLFKANVNILDISQTTMQGVFTMTMIVDLEQSKTSVHELSDMFKKLSKEIHQEIYIYDERIVRAMHRI